MQTNAYAGWSRPLSGWGHRRWLAAGAVAFAVAVLLALSVRTIVRIPTEALPNVPGQAFNDFESYYSAALAFRDGESVYDRVLGWRDASFTLGSPDKEQPNAFQYPPLFLLAFLPLSFLPFQFASILWLASTVAALIASVYILLGMVLSVRPQQRLGIALIVTAALALTFPIRTDLNAGQADAFLLLLLTLSMSALLSRDDKRAGVLLGVAIAIKPFLGFVILYFLWKRAYGASFLAAGTAAILTLASFAVIGWAALGDFISIAQYLSGPVFAVTPNNQSIHGMLLRLFTENPFTAPIVDLPYLVIRGVWLTMAAGVVLVLAATIRRERTLPSRQQALEFGLVIVGMLFVTPLAEHIHYVYLVIPTVALIGALIASRRSNPPAIWLLLSLAVLYLAVLPPRFQALLTLFDSYKDAPIALPMALLSGALLLWLCGFAALMLVTLREQRPPIAQPDRG